MSKFNEISEIIPNRLYLINLEGATNVKAILDLQINTIVSVLHFNPFGKTKPVQYSNIKCIYYYADDEETFKISKYFDDFNNLMKDNPNDRVLVHCLAGASRSASVVASYLIKDLVNTKTEKIMKKYDITKIINQLQKIREVVNPNDGFINELIDYRNKLIGDKTK